MSRTLWGTIAIGMLIGVTATAQQPAPQRTPPQIQPAQQKSATPPTEQATTVTPREPPGQPINIKFDLTITDQAGPGEAAKKTVSVVVADRSAGSVRSTGNQVQARINVDVTPTILTNGNVRAMIGLEYNPRQVADPKAPTFPSPELPIGGTSLNERITLILEPGKSLVISQAADPVSERKITVEVRATILK
jgi:hypothetical protein